MSTHKARVEPAPPPATEAPPATAPTLTHYSSSVQSVGQRRASFIAEHLQDPPPEQIFRAASPAFMLWLLEELTARDPKAKLDSISTHDLTMGAAFKLKMHKKTGFGYGPPETEACIRSLTKEGKTSVYKFITSTGGLTWRKAGTSQPAGVELTDADGRLSKMLQEKTEMDEDECYEMDEDECYGFGIIDLHAKHFVKVGNSYCQSQTRWRYQAAQPLRDKCAWSSPEPVRDPIPAATLLRVASPRLVNRFGDEWWKKCFGPATHFASHAWDCSFAGLIEAIRGLPTWAFVWVDVIAINQHHAAQDERTADLGSLEHVIRHTGRVHLYFEPLQKAKAITRLWVLFELATNFDAHGELSLGFSKDGYDTLMSVAKELAKEFEFEDDLRRAPARAKASHLTICTRTRALAISARPRRPPLLSWQVLDNALYHIKSSRAKARIKEDEDRIKGIIKSRPGGEKAFDELITNEVMAVIDATMWAERCKECYSEYSLARVLEEALPLFITRKHAFHQLLKQEGAASLALAITPVRRRPSATPRVPARWNRWKRPSRISSGWR